MELVKLGDDLYEVRLPTWYWSSKKILVQALLKLQGEGKVITDHSRLSGWHDCYLICTTDKK